jgi:2-polyprenyl-3-methyl-5-hydroxy-6-metoxy-1,4-benzoquinol methylase
MDFFIVNFMEKGEGMETKRIFGIELVSPSGGSPLIEKDGSFVSHDGEKYPIVNDIPRFVSSDNYASSFGLQWNTYKKVQLDSYTQTTISRDRLQRLLGGSFEEIRGKNVLEAGCGAGRFTEILLANGSHVFAADISSAVEANYENCRSFPDYFVCQADITALPVQPGSFEVVICVGVIQHTPNPEMTIAALCSYVKPGGLLVIDHYTHGYPNTPVRRILRAVLLRTSPQFSMSFTKALTSLLWPVHRHISHWKAKRILGKIRYGILYLSPIVDYHEPYPQLSGEQMKMWAMLDTHDTLTDRFKHLRSGPEIQEQLEKCGMINIHVEPGGNGIEVRARKKPETGVEQPSA